MTARPGGDDTATGDDTGQGTTVPSLRTLAWPLRAHPRHTAAADPPVAAGGRLTVPALVVISGLAALSYAWELGRDPLEPYYAAAVRSMSTSWHDFLFGAFDPSGTVTVRQAARARFGCRPWPCGLSACTPGCSCCPRPSKASLTVLVLYRAVGRLAGPAAGLIASAVLAVSPATVAFDRGNISDSLMILLLVLAADAVSAALAGGGGRRLALAGVWVGLAFQAKMIEAWLVLPAFGLAYFLERAGIVAPTGSTGARSAAPSPVWCRCRG